MLILSRRTNESIIINDDIEIAVIDVKGDQVKIGITAPRRVKVYRKEVYEAIQRENQAAILSASALPSIRDLLERSKTPDQPEKDPETRDPDPGKPPG